MYPFVKISFLLDVTLNRFSSERYFSSTGFSVFLFCDKAQRLKSWISELGAPKFSQNSGRKTVSSIRLVTWRRNWLCHIWLSLYFFNDLLVNRVCVPVNRFNRLEILLLVNIRNEFFIISAQVTNIFLQNNNKIEIYLIFSFRLFGVDSSQIFMYKNAP